MKQADKQNKKNAGAHAQPTRQALRLTNLSLSLIHIALALSLMEMMGSATRRESSSAIKSESTSRMTVI